MSVISMSGLTLGYLTLPFLSAAGCPGSYFSLKSELSMRVLPSPTKLTSSVRSTSVWKVEILRRYGSAPGLAGVESALAMFSEMMRMRPAWARRPLAAIAMVLRKSTSVSFDQSLRSPALAEREFQQAEAAGVERGDGLI